MPGRPTQFSGSTHTHTQCRSAQKPRPKYIWQPCRFLSSTYVLPFSPLSLPFLLTLFGQFFLCASLLVGLSVSRVFRVFGLINWVNGAYENLEFAMSRWQRRQHGFNNLLKRSRRQKLLAKTKEFVGKLKKRKNIVYTNIDRRGKETGE